MTLHKFDSSVIVETHRPDNTWCVFEHLAVIEPDAPPATILIAVCKLVEVYRLTDGRNNSEWMRLYQNGGSVQVRIRATTEDRAEAYRYAGSLLRDIEPKPLCNVKGFNVRGTHRAVMCLTNGKTYHTQREAALDLGIAASSLSRHLRGQLQSVNGLKFIHARGD